MIGLTRGGCLNRLAPIVFVAVAFARAVGAGTNFYVDPDWTGIKSGTQSRPFAILERPAWYKINTALASGDVTIYFSALKADGVTQQSVARFVQCRRTDYGPNRLILDGYSFYNSSETSPHWLPNPDADIAHAYPNGNVWPSDGSAASVQYIHDNEALNGDTITLPAGTFTWSTTVTISKGITLQGAGSDLTVIERSGTAPLIQIQGLPSDLPVRVTGIRFNAPVGQNGDLTAIYITGSYGGTWGYTQIRIDNCYFYGGERNIFFRYRASGVVDHCTFQDVVIATEVYGDDDYAWARAGAPQFGTADTTVFFEDNYFIADSAITYFDTLGDTFTGGRFTWRYNTFDLSAFSAWNFGSLITAHGNQAYWAGINDWNGGGIMCEFYENTVYVSQAYRILWFRGGRNLVANNAFNGTISTVVAFSEEEPSQIVPP